MEAERHFTDPRNPIGELPAVPRIAIVSRLLPDAGPIGFAMRDSTGWTLFAGNEPAEFSDDASNFAPALVSTWMDRDPAFRKVAAAPPGWEFAAKNSGSGGERRLVRIQRDPPPRALALVQSDWSSFQRSLEDVLYELAQRGDSFLVCTDRATDRYVQFHANDGLSLSSESVSDAYLPPGKKIDQTTQAALVTAGWLPPDDPRNTGSNFFRDWYNPAPLRRISELAVYTLRHLHQADLACIESTLDLR